VKLSGTAPRFSANYNAFPSAHTAASTAFFAALLLGAGWRIAAPVLVVPVLIAFSRMYGAAHYLSDVTVAAILGILCTMLITRWLLKQKAATR
jgi:membrane-associated phospholipid phosphatase